MERLDFLIRHNLTSACAFCQLHRRLPDGFALHCQYSPDAVVAVEAWQIGVQLDEVSPEQGGAEREEVARASPFTLV